MPFTTTTFARLPEPAPVQTLRKPRVPVQTSAGERHPCKPFARLTSYIATGARANTDRLRGTRANRKETGDTVQTLAWTQGTRANVPSSKGTRNNWVHVQTLEVSFCVCTGARFHSWGPRANVGARGREVGRANVAKGAPVETLSSDSALAGHPCKPFARPTRGSQRAPVQTSSSHWAPVQTSI